MTDRNRVVPIVLTSVFNFCGNFSIASANIPELGPDVKSETGFFITPASGNIGKLIKFSMIEAGANYDGFPVLAGNVLFLDIINLNLLEFAVETNGDKICWCKA